MPIDILTTVDIIEVMENYIEKIRPPENIRTQLDIGYTIENQSLLLVQITPDWSNPIERREYVYAKATFIKSKNLWKIFWMRASLKWQSYEPMREVVTLHEFLAIVDEDAYHCFKG